MLDSIDSSEIEKTIEKALSQIKEDTIKKEACILIYKLTDICKKARMFAEMPGPLKNLAYNALSIQLFQRTACINKWNKSNIISIVNKSINHIKLVIRMIVDLAEELHDSDKKEAFYNLMGENHIVMANSYVLGSDSFNFIINKLCKEASIKQLNHNLSAEKALAILSKRNQIKMCSRLQRALNILMQYSSTSIASDKNEISDLNATKLKISNDDIYSLQLLKQTSNLDNMSDFLGNSVYKSIYIKTKTSEEKKQTISDLYIVVYNMFIDISIAHPELYITKCSNTIKVHLNDLRNLEFIGIHKSIPSTLLLNSIKECKNNNFKFEESFANNLIQGYLESTKNYILVITKPFTQIQYKYINVFTPKDTIIPALMVTLVVISSILLIYIVKKEWSALAN
ncbi:hypothetical protein NEPAR04_0281 [Nematocida parisii]|nr:hypothetical protein NEPAR08_0275 [Nematocida parisii]KAI5126204.1 hypothetical protein NEPAR03_0376 [Nematocida parisii]KAI5140449.1 hypothetical protein NEPAR04_0281 [Nematocida parisii]